MPAETPDTKRFRGIDRKLSIHFVEFGVHFAVVVGFRQRKVFLSGISQANFVQKTEKLSVHWLDEHLQR